MFNFSLHDISSHICLESLQTSPLMPSNPNNQLIILYINSVSQSICLSVEVLKPRSLLIKLSPRTRGPKNYSGPRVLTSYFYFYFYVCFCFRATTAVVNGGGIFWIWRVGEEIWVRFFWAKGLGRS
jgi:hypothetical protein